MTVRELIAMLQRDAHLDDEVLVWNGDAEEYMPVTGMVYGGGNHTVELMSDSDE